MDGEIMKAIPLADVPKELPPVAAFHQFIEFPVEVALKLMLEPEQIAAGLAVTVPGTATIVQVTKTLTQEVVLQIPSART